MVNKYCKNCLRWSYGGINNCTIPNPGFTQNCVLEDGKFKVDEPSSEEKAFKKAKGEKTKTPYINLKKMQFILRHMDYVGLGRHDKSYIYGKPSQLNKDNDCIFYKALPKCLQWLTPFLRIFY